MLDKAVEIVDKKYAVKLCTNEDGSGAAVFAVQPSRSSQWARRHGSSSAAGAQPPQLGDTFHGEPEEVHGIYSHSKAPYVVFQNTCSCPDFLSAVSSLQHYRPLVSCPPLLLCAPHQAIYCSANTSWLYI